MLMQTGWIQASRIVTRWLAWDPTCLPLSLSFPIKDKQNLKVLKSRRQYNHFLENYPVFKGLMHWTEKFCIPHEFRLLFGSKWQIQALYVICHIYKVLWQIFKWWKAFNFVYWCIMVIQFEFCYIIFQYLPCK